MISQPWVCLAQTMHLSCTDTNTVSKQKDERFHMTHITYEFHHVCLKWFSNLRHVWRKPCVYLASRLAISPNGPKWAFTWASSPRSTIGCVQNDFWAIGTLGATMQQSCTDTNMASKRNKWDATRPTSPRSSIWCIKNNVRAYGTFDANRAPNLRQD
jgi:hypothetical protein